MNGTKFTTTWLDKLKPAKDESRFYEVGRPGFQLRVLPPGPRTPKGTKAFFYRYMRGKKRRAVALGIFPTTTLEAAHDRYEEARKLVDDGQDPAMVFRAREAAEVEAGTVEELINEWYERYAKKERKRPEQAKGLLDGNVPKHFLRMKAKDVTRREVIKITDEIADRSASVANDVASLLKQVFAFGVERDLIGASPIVGMKPPGGTEKPRERVLSDNEIKAFWSKLPKCVTRETLVGKKKHRVHGISERVQLALRLILLTAQRRGETAMARWADIDFDEKTWTIPAEHAKTEQAHMVPLSPAALEILERLQELQPEGQQSAYVFPSHHRIIKADAPMTERAISHAVREHEEVFGIPHWTPHDLRRTARTHMARLGVADTVAELILNHRLGGMAGVYNRHSYLDEKRAALDLWAAHVQTLVSKKKT